MLSSSPKKQWEPDLNVFTVGITRDTTRVARTYNQTVGLIIRVEFYDASKSKRVKERRAPQIPLCL